MASKELATVAICSSLTMGVNLNLCSISDLNNGADGLCCGALLFMMPDKSVHISENKPQSSLIFVIKLSLLNVL